MKRIFLDTNILLDVLLDRKPYVDASAAVWTSVENGRAEGFVAAHSITTIFYIAQKAAGASGARRIITKLTGLFQIAAVDSNTVSDALRLKCPDFEDAVTSAAASSSGCDYIVSRDPRGFVGSRVPCVPPEMILPLLG